MEHTLTKIFSPYIQEVVAGRPTVLSLAPFSVPLCYQGVSRVTHQKDCTTIHWLIIQYSPRQLVVTKQGCSSSMVFHCEYTGTSDPFTCKTPCPQTTITVERTCMYHKYSEMTSHCNHDPTLRHLFSCSSLPPLQVDLQGPGNQAITTSHTQWCRNHVRSLPISTFLTCEDSRLISRLFENWNEASRFFANLKFQKVRAYLCLLGY